MGRNLSVLVKSEGVVLFPESLREELGLRPGDLLSVEGRPPLCFSLEPYRDLLGASMLNPEAIKMFALRFLARPLTAVEEDHSLHIPPEVFPLPAGSRLTVFVDGEDGHRMQVFVNV